VNGTSLETGTFTLVPNPATDEVTLQFTNGMQASQVVNVAVFDLGGRVMPIKWNTPLQLDISALPAGVFLVVVRTRGGQLSTQLVKSSW
jgi:hypothetical protein